MPKIISRNIFVLLASRFYIKRQLIFLHKAVADEPSVVEAPKKQEKQDHTKKLECFNLQPQRRL